MPHLPRPSPPWPARHGGNRPAIKPDVHSRPLPEVRNSLSLVTRSAQPLQIVVVVRAAVGKRFDVVKLSRHRGAAHGAHRILAEQSSAQRLQRPAADAMHLIFA